VLRDARRRHFPGIARRQIVVECDARRPSSAAVGLLGPLSRWRYTTRAGRPPRERRRFRGTGIASRGHGWGKSTMAVSSPHASRPDQRRCHRNRRAWSHRLSSFPQLKLWPDALAALDTAADALPRVHPELPKRALQVAHRFGMTRSRCADFTCSARAMTRIEKLAPRRASRRSCVTLWCPLRPGLLCRVHRGEQFLRTTQLGRAVPVRRLRRPATLASDPDSGPPSSSKFATTWRIRSNGLHIDRSSTVSATSDQVSGDLSGDSSAETVILQLSSARTISSIASERGLGADSHPTSVQAVLDRLLEEYDVSARSASCSALLRSGVRKDVEFPYAPYVNSSLCLRRKADQSCSPSRR